MPSPIRQAQRQSEFLRTILQRYRAELVGRKALGFRTVSRVMVGTDQRGFKRMPMQLVISVSDRGRITRMDGWTKPRKPFQVYVTKADLVPDKIARVIKRHRKGASLVGTITWTNEYGLWDMQEEEVLTVAEFLASRNSGVASASLPASPQTTAEPANPTSQDKPSPEPPCKHCGSGSLNAQWGKFGYYWRAHRKNNHPKPLGGKYDWRSRGSIGACAHGRRLEFRWLRRGRTPRAPVFPTGSDFSCRFFAPGTHATGCPVFQANLVVGNQCANTLDQPGIPVASLRGACFLDRIAVKLGEGTG